MSTDSNHSCPLCVTAEACRTGSHPDFIAELGETFCILGENQGCAGWCVLVLKDHAEHVADLPIARQEAIWRDVARVVAAQRTVFGPVRINYECLGNVVPHIHWHLIPRHANDPDPRSPVWGWPAAALKGGLTRADRDTLIGQLRTGVV